MASSGLFYFLLRRSGRHRRRILAGYLAALHNCHTADILSGAQPLSPRMLCAYLRTARAVRLGTPLPVLVRKTWFFRDQFHCSRQVLLPRPETEYLVAYLVEHRKLQPGMKLLDIGTGSGVIALSLCKYTGVRTWGVDISTRALRVARRNADALLDRSHELHLEHGDITDYRFRNRLAAQGPFDYIVANFPYVAKRDKMRLSWSVRRYDPSRALYGGDDGLKFYRIMPILVGELLHPQGEVYLECGYGQMDKVVKMLQFFKFYHIMHDIRMIPRYYHGRGYGSRA